jgi:tetratricopeptide (TPR) repeat protein
VSAMFQRLVTSGKRLSFAQNDPVAAKDAGAKFLKACAEYRKDVTDPNSTLPKEALEKARAKLMDLTLWEISVSLDPMQDADNVLKRVDDLEKQLGKDATEDQQVSFLQYRIKAYIIKKNGLEAVKAAEDFIKRFPERGTQLMQGMVSKWQEDIEDAVAKKQQQRAKDLSGQLVDLLASLINVTSSKPILATDEAGKAKEEAEKKTKVYKYQQFQGQTMVAAAQYSQAVALFASLEKEKPEDAFNKFWTAHAYFGDGKYLEAQKIYSDLIGRLRADSGPWWECYYRMIKANEFLIPKSSPADQQKRQQQNSDALKDLTAMYGRDKIGGEKLRAEFLELLNVYKTPDMTAPKPPGA